MKLLPLLLLLALPAVAQAQFTFTTSNGAVTVTGYTGSNGVAMIPGTIAGLPVTSIGDFAFYAASVTSVLIPDTVTNLGDGAFFDCQSLTNVTLGNSVTNIGDWAFGFCPSLMSVSCRGNAPGLGGGNVFYGNAATIYYLSGTIGWGPLLAGHPAVLWNPPVPYNYTTNNSTITITGYTGSGGTVAIPSSINFLPVTSIGDFAFENCNNLTNVTIPNSVTKIGAAAFYRCFNLTRVLLPDSITSIGNDMFEFCNLTNITIPGSVTNIGEFAFSFCTHLVSISIPDSVTSIGDTAFEFCTSLSSLTIPSSVSSIGDFAFNYCTSLTNVTILNGISTLGDCVFAECASLTSITIPKSVTKIGGEAFRRCASLTAIMVDASNSFYRSIAGVLFDKSQTLLVEFPGGKVGSYTIPNSVTSIGNYAFEFCTSLTSVTIPNSVSSIGGNAFVNCTSLNSVTIPSSVTSIGVYAFAYSANLSAIFFNGNAPVFFGSSLFYLSPVTVYYLPGTTGWDATFAGRPPVLWNPLAQTGDGSFGVRTNQFGFNVTGSSNLVIVVEGCTNLFNSDWQPVQTNTLTTGSAYFSDPQWTNYPGRFYRLRSP